jgi:hypothetical protein
VQVNFIPGACLLVPSVHHAAFDAIGMVIFLKIWRGRCRDLSLESCGRFESVPMLPKEKWDRTYLDTTDLSGSGVVLALLWRTLVRARIAARGLSEVDVKTDLDSLAELQIGLRSDLRICSIRGISVESE